MLKIIDYMLKYDFNKFCNVMFGYCGGKKRIFEYIAFLIYISGTETLMELCAGAAYVSLNINVKNKVLNDISFPLAIIYKALSIPDIADNVLSRIKAADYSYDVLKEVIEYWEYVDSYIAKLIRNYKGTNNDAGDNEKIGQDIKNKFLSSLNGQNLCDAAYCSWILHSFSWLANKIDYHFYDITNKRNKFIQFQDNIINYYHRLDNAQVSSENVLDILERLADNPNKISNNTVIYLDPPYLEANEENDIPAKSRKKPQQDYDGGIFTEEYHLKMLELVNELPRDKCKIIISGYYNDLYTDTLNRKEFGEWNCIFTKEIPVMCGNGNNYKEKGRPNAKEYLFTNISL